MLIRGKSTGETDVACFFCVPNVPHFWCCPPWSYGAFKTNNGKELPSQQQPTTATVNYRATIQVYLMRYSTPTPFFPPTFHLPRRKRFRVMQPYDLPGRKGSISTITKHTNKTHFPPHFFDSEKLTDSWRLSTTPTRHKTMGQYIVLFGQPSQWQSSSVFCFCTWCPGANVQ